MPNGGGHTISVWITPDEDHLLRRAQESTGKERSQLIRELIRETLSRDGDASYGQSLREALQTYARTAKAAGAAFLIIAISLIFIVWTTLST